MVHYILLETAYIIYTIYVSEKLGLGLGGGGGHTFKLKLLMVPIFFIFLLSETEVSMMRMRNNSKTKTLVNMLTSILLWFYSKTNEPPRGKTNNVVSEQV